MGVSEDARTLAEAARFREAIRNRTPHAFVTPTVVAVNVAVYIWIRPGAGSR